MANTVGVIGLGIMGGAYAQNLLKAGFDVVGCDPSSERREALVASGGRTVPNASELGRMAQRILTSLPSSEALRSVVAELASSVRPGTVLIETSTLSPDDKIAAAIALPETVMLDCPVSGTGAQARNADLVVFGSGDEEAFDRCADIFAAISRKWSHLGVFGNGMRMKLIANHLVTIHNAAAGEAMALAVKSGIAPDLVYDTLAASAATSRMFEVRGPLMAEGRYDGVTATVRTHLKDLSLISGFADSLDMPLPLFDEASLFYREAEEAGFAELDTAVVCRIAERRGGVRRGGAS